MGSIAEIVILCLHGNDILLKYLYLSVLLSNVMSDPVVNQL